MAPCYTSSARSERYPLVFKGKFFLVSVDARRDEAARAGWTRRVLVPVVAAEVVGYLSFDRFDDDRVTLCVVVAA